RPTIDGRSCRKNQKIIQVGKSRLDSIRFRAFRVVRSVSAGGPRARLCVSGAPGSGRAGDPEPTRKTAMASSFVRGEHELRGSGIGGGRVPPDGEGRAPGAEARRGIDGRRRPLYLPPRDPARPAGRPTRGFMTITAESAQAALQKVDDPELHRPLSDLGMV